MVVYVDNVRVGEGFVVASAAPLAGVVVRCESPGMAPVVAMLDLRGKRHHKFRVPR